MELISKQEVTYIFSEVAEMSTPPFRVKALYDYSSPHDDDLSFPNGQVITVTDEEDVDWYYGEYADASGTQHEGLFPRNFVEKFEPETPPRPMRSSRPKKEPEPSQAIDDDENGPVTGEPRPSSPQADSVPTQVENTDLKQQSEQQQRNTQAPQKQTFFAPPPAIITAKPAPPAASKPPPPAVEKPALGSFRDRINAFNKPADPPVAPTKPSGLGASGGSGFVKKPFVAPPPSKNAYVPSPREPPAQKIYRREENPELVAQPSNSTEQAEPTAATHVTSEDITEDQPKPTSLKDRIALLQKQQIEQAARHADAGQRKEKPKKPTKKHVDPQETTINQEEELEGENLERRSTEVTGNRSTDAPRDASSLPGPGKSLEATPLGSPTVIPARELLSDANDADQSGAGDTEDGEELSIGQDDSDEKPGRIAIPLQKPSQAPTREPDVDVEDANAERKTQGDDDDGEEEEEDVDPEVKRRMEIRERMAKMSGGMGMAGMFGPPGGMPPKAPAKQNSTSSERKSTGNSTATAGESPVSRAPPVPIMHMPGLQKVRSPEQNDSEPDFEKEDPDVIGSVVHGSDPKHMPDVEDIEEKVIPMPRRSTERTAPPPIPQGII